jgi:NADH:ubiquinone oxidoreductase subunit 3 (subunit A)
MTPLAAYLLLFVAVGVGFIFVHLVAGKLIRPSKPNAEKKTIYECGEPTIGSSWIQFDLRFYVVALLFVIFDVEVAFFFPWAEVFGKANTLADATKPTTAAEYRAYAEKVLDLALPPASSAQQRATLARYEVVAERTVDGRPLLDAQGYPTLLSGEQRAALEEILGRGLNNEPLLDADGKPRILSEERLQKMIQAQKEAKAKAGAQRTDAENKLAQMEGPLKAAPVNEFQENLRGARGLARMALFEILVFFGVLLVGFAYLWRRGDLAWVRSTAAEAEAGTVRPQDRETRRQGDKEPRREEADVMVG